MHFLVTFKVGDFSMVMAHDGSFLQLQKHAPNLPTGMFLFPLAGTLRDTTDTIPILSTGPEVYRKDEKKFRESLAIDRSTVNLIPFPEDLTKWTGMAVSTVTKGHLDPEGGQTAFKISPTAISQDLYTDYATTAIANRPFTLSVWLRSDVPSKVTVKVQDTNNVEATSTTFDVSVEWKRYDVTCIFTATNTRTAVRAIMWAGGFAGTTTPCYVWHPQLEELKFSTSYVKDNRPTLSATWDVSQLNMKDRGCASFWMYLTDSFFNAKSGNNVYTVKFGTNRPDNSGAIYGDTINFMMNGARRLNFWTRKTNADKTFTNHDLQFPQIISTYANVGNWCHVVIQWDKQGMANGNNKEVYFNGTLIAAAKTDILSDYTMKYMRIGWDDTGLTPNTLFEHLAIHPSKTFSAEEIQLWYESNAPFFDGRDQFNYY